MNEFHSLSANHESWNFDMQYTPDLHVVLHEMLPSYQSVTPECLPLCSTIGCLYLCCIQLCGPLSARNKNYRVTELQNFSERQSWHQLKAYTKNIFLDKPHQIYGSNRHLHIQCTVQLHVVCARVAWDKQHVQDLHVHAASQPR